MKRWVSRFASRQMGRALKAEVADTHQDRAPNVLLLRGHTGELTAVFKVFDSKAELHRELASQTMLREAKLATTDSCGVIAKQQLRSKSGEKRYAALISAAKGERLNDSILAIEGLRGMGRSSALLELRERVELVAESLAEMHAGLPHREVASGAMRKREVKRARSKVEALLTSLRAIGVAVHETRILTALDERARTYLATSYPGAATHGDAHSENFFVDRERRKVTPIDSEAIVKALDSSGRGEAVGGVDAVRIIESIRVEAHTAAITKEETARIVSAFRERYRERTALTKAQIAALEAFHAPCLAGRLSKTQVQAFVTTPGKVSEADRRHAMKRYHRLLDRLQLD